MKQGLPANNGLSDFVLGVPELLPRAAGEPLLTDVQFASLEAGVATGADLLVSAPTSTGKTLIGWWAIASAIKSGGRAVYLVSHRALAKQKFEEAQRLFLNGLFAGDRSAIVCATGDGVEDASGRKTNAPLAASLVVATYEKFLGCLSVGGPPKDLTDTAIVCDEIQLIGDAHRGRNVELLLTLLRRSGWRQLVGLSAVISADDGQSLADWLRLGLVRNVTREKALRIECRTPTHILEVSASPGHVGELTQREGRANQGPLDIVGELLARPGAGPVITFCMKVDQTYELCRDWSARRPETMRVVVPQGLELDAQLRSALGRRAAFHNAELGEDERLYVEERIASGLVDVVFATSTLAAGVNFPLGSAVFAAWKRWNFDRGRAEPIGRAEFQNMAGRVGRMGQAAAEGLVILAADGGASANQASQLMDLSAQDELGIGIHPEDFGSLTLQLFAGRLCANRRDAFDLIASTLSASREAALGDGTVNHWEPELNAQIDRLVRAGCLIEGRSQVSATAFGVAVARSGLKPETVLFFIEGLVRRSVELSEMLPSDEEPGTEDDLLFVLAHAALTSPEFNSEGGEATRRINWRVGRMLVGNDFARRLDRLLWERPWQADVSASNGALLVTGWAAGETRLQLDARVPGVRLGVIEATARDVAWILTGIAEIIAEMTSPVLADESKPEALRGSGAQTQAARRLARSFRRVASRIASGLPSDILWMTSLELRNAARRRLTRTQMLALRHQGLTRPHELMDGGAPADERRRLALVAGEEGPALANQVRDAARIWKQDEREHFRRLHVRRAERMQAEAIIAAMYDARGDALEAVFEQAMSLVAVGCERLDQPGNQAHPDFLVTIEEFPSIVVELKTKANDAALVPLNAATEVLSASELIGLGGSFCVTVCSPGVEPNVPGIIERCGRLCVVSTSDLAEAILRLREGSLTREGLYNWLTTPGVALREDLPHPR
ncbi:DEAD/DEAH box helicase [Brevundimonas sp. M20]|nr:DEAD/DEAH box helicase [Brevundimonas sp. M20]